MSRYKYKIIIKLTNKIGKDLSLIVHEFILPNITTVKCLYRDVLCDILSYKNSSNMLYAQAINFNRVRLESGMAGLVYST